MALEVIPWHTRTCSSTYVLSHTFAHPCYIVHYCQNEFLKCLAITDEELEIKASRTSTVQRGPKPHSTPAAAAQNPVALQAPPPPGHHLQTPGHRPLPPSHRTHEHQQKRRPPPSGTQIHQQKGPPLPRPRVQPKPPCGSGEGVSLPPPN